MWAAMQVGEAISGFHKILVFAETIDDRIERGRIYRLIEGFWLLHFSPEETMSMLQRIADGQALSEDDRLYLHARLRRSHRGVRRVLEELRRLVDSHGGLLTPEERGAIMHLQYGKANARRMIEELAFETRSPAARALAAEIVDQIRLVNTTLESLSNVIRQKVNDTPVIRPRRRGAVFWSILLAGFVMWSLVMLGAGGLLLRAFR